MDSAASPSTIATFPDIDTDIDIDIDTDATASNAACVPSAPPAVGWSVQDVLDIYQQPLPDLMWQAQTVHRRHHDALSIEAATLMSIKTGACPEDCAYCPQSSRHATSVVNQPLATIDGVTQAAQLAKRQGARRFCMGAAWRSPTARQLDDVAERIRAVKALGLETCVTLGMLKPGQAEVLHDAGLDYYNHNLDTAPEFYGTIISTRHYQDRLDTLKRVRDAGIKVCCGGIVGMGEDRRVRAGLIAQLASLDPYPESVPVNNLVRVAGTPLADQPELDPVELVRTIATARITMPRAVVRLSAGRETLSDEAQALCFLAGANSVFLGEALLTTPNPLPDRDAALFRRLGLIAGGQAHGVEVQA